MSQSDESDSRDDGRRPLPSQHREPITDEADRVLTDYDDLYRYDPTHVEPATIRDLRAELDLNQGEVAARASEQTAAAQSTVATRLSCGKAGAPNPIGRRQRRSSRSSSTPIRSNSGR